MRTIKRDIVGAFIFSSDNKILLGHSGVFEGQWCVPGGGIEDETELEALFREVKEEVNLDLSDAEIIQCDDVDYATSEKTLRDTGERVLVDMKFIDFIVKMPFLAEEVVFKCADDFRDGKWFSKAELAVEDIAPGTKRRLGRLGFMKT